MPLTRDEDIRELLDQRADHRHGRRVGPARPAILSRDEVPAGPGLSVIPVNPQITGEHVHGEYVWRELAQIGEPIDIVDIFRRPEAAGEAVDQAIAVGAKAVWMQIGVIDEEAREAEAAGLKVVMDRCPKIEIMRNKTLSSPSRPPALRAPDEVGWETPGGAARKRLCADRAASPTTGAIHGPQNRS